MKKFFTRVLFTILLSGLFMGNQQVMAQAGGTVAYHFKGTVTDAKNQEPIPGATVVIVNQNLGTATDRNGKYDFTAKLKPGKYQIAFSTVGYKTVVKDLNLGDNTNITMNMAISPDITRLNEVVVTGVSGFTKKSHLGNSISTVSSKDIQETAPLSIGAALQGNVAGALVMRNSGNPAGGITVRLRGASTVVGSSDPLYIIDGVIVNNKSAQLINLGGYTQNRLVDIDPEEIDHIEVLKGAAAAAIYGSQASNGVVQIFTKRGQNGKPKITFSTSVNMNEIRKILPWNDAQLKWDPNHPGQTIPATRYNYQAYIFRKAYGTKNYVSVSGGKGNTKYIFSASQYYNGGILRNTDFSRYNLRVRLDQVITRWWSVSVGTLISRNSSHEMPNGKNYGPITSLLFADNSKDPRPVDGVYPNIGWMANPYEAVDRIEAPQSNSRTLSDIQMKFTPLKGFNITYIFGYDHAYNDARLFIPVGFNTKPYGVSEKATMATTMTNSDLNASYSFHISPVVTSVTGAGYTYQYDESQYFAIRTDHLAPVAKVTDAGSLTGRSDYRTQRSIWGGYLQQTFGFKEKVFVTLAGRWDGASTFGIDERNQFYPKASASYLMSKENFWKHSLGKAINMFKIRVSYGQAGNLSALAPYSIYTSYNLAPINGQTGLVAPLRAGNPNLRPERQTEIETGFDMGLLNDRLGIVFTWYKQDIKDLLLLRSMAPSTGYGNRYENVGTMTNKGWELAVRAMPIQKKNFTWNITATFSQNHNLVTHVVGGKIDLGMWGTSIAQSGQPLGVFYGYFYATKPDGSLLLDSKGFVQRAKGHYENKTLPDGEVIPVAVQDYDPATGQPKGINLKKIIGDPNPKWIGSISNTFSYKGWSLFVKIDMVQGFNVMDWDQRMFDLFPGGEATAKELRGEIPKGSSFPKFFIYQSFIDDGSFVKLRDIALSYNLKIKSDWVHSLKFSLSGNNLVSWDHYWGYDPEINTEAQSNGVRGQDMATVPIPREIRFGIVASFN